MAENTKNVEFKNPHPELPVREPILKLGKMVTDRAAIKLGLEKLTADVAAGSWKEIEFCNE